MSRVSRPLRMAVLVWTLLLSSCSDAPTEIHVIVQSDLVDPAELDELRVTATLGGAAMMTSTARLGAGEPPLPRTLVLAHRGGPLGPVRIEAQAFLGATLRVTTVRELAFQEGRVLTVHIDLDRACEGTACPGATCGPRGVCRPIEVSPCELESACEDAGAPDGGGLDASDGGPADADTSASDTPIDAVTPCYLGSTLCLAESYVIGEEVALVPCTAVPVGITLHHRTRLPDGVTEVVADTIRITQAGEHTVTVSQEGSPGCQADGAFIGHAFGMVAGAGRPATMIRDYRDMAARLDMAFLATRAAGWAVTDTGWRDLRVGASGVFVNDNLAAVEVLQGHAFFGRDGDDAIISRVTVADGFSSIAIADVAIPAAGDRTVRTMAVPFSATASGSEGPLVMGTRTGWVLLEGAADALVARALGPAWDVEEDVAIALMDSPMRGRLWGLSRGVARNFNDTTGNTGAFNMGNVVALPGGATEGRALAVDDRAADFGRLWVCSDDVGVQVFDLLATDWSGRAFFPTPLATIGGACRDLALDPSDGGAWVATSTGLLRLNHDGAVLGGAALGAASGIPAGGVTLVSVAFDGTRRQVWVLTDTASVYRVEAAN